MCFLVTAASLSPLFHSRPHHLLQRRAALASASQRLLQGKIPVLIRYCFVVVCRAPSHPPENKHRNPQSWNAKFGVFGRRQSDVYGQERRRWSIVSKSARGLYLLDQDLKSEFRREGVQPTAWIWVSVSLSLSLSLSVLPLTPPPSCTARVHVRVPPHDPEDRGVLQRTRRRRVRRPGKWRCSVFVSRAASFRVARVGR